MADVNSALNNLVWPKTLILTLEKCVFNLDINTDPHYLFIDTPVLQKSLE